MGMVFAHAPVIMPAVFRVTVPYRSWFYGHVVLLHTSPLLRVVGGDLIGNRIAWQFGGVLNEVALLLFIGATATAVASARRRRTTQPLPTTRRPQVADSMRGTQP